MVSTADPERICELIGTYPEFKQLYADIYELCRSVEDIMGLFSKELLELDRNTVQYMIDEMQEEIDSSKKTIAEKEHQLVEKDQLLTEQGQQLEVKNKQLQQQEIEKQLYSLLSRDGRLEDLGRAVTDANYCDQLLEEYGLIL